MFLRGCFLGIFLLLNQLTISSQNDRAILIFHDGSTVEGYGKLKSQDRVKFRKSKQDKAIKYHFRDLKKVTIYNDYAETIYVYQKIKGKKMYEVMEVVVVGEMSLYKKVTYGTHAGGMGAGGFGGSGGVGFGMTTSYTIEDYYVKRKDEQEVTHLGSTDLFSKNFKKAAGGYFADCPSLVKKIQTKEYKKRDIEEIVSYYNSECN